MYKQNKEDEGERTYDYWYERIVLFIILFTLLSFIHYMFIRKSQSIQVHYSCGRMRKRQTKASVTEQPLSCSIKCCQKRTLPITRRVDQIKFTMIRRLKSSVKKCKSDSQSLKDFFRYNSRDSNTSSRFRRIGCCIQAGEMIYLIIVPEMNINKTTYF